MVDNKQKTGADYLSEAERIAYNDLKKKKYSDLTFAEKAKLSYYGAKASYLETAPPLQRAAVVSMRSEDSELEDVVEYYYNKGKTEGLSVEESDVYFQKYETLKRKQDLIKEEEEKEQKAKDEYEAAYKKLTREGVSLDDALMIEAYEDKHSILGFLESSGTKQRVEDAISAAEALTEQQNKRSVRGYEIYDADAVEKSIGKSYDESQKQSEPNGELIKSRKDTMFPFPEELVTKQRHSLIGVGQNSRGELYKLIPSVKEEFIEDINANPKTRIMTGKTSDSNYEKGYEELSRGYSYILDNMFKAQGLGPIDNQYSSWMKYVDRSQINIVPHNTETSDITLMTRPSLPMNSASLKLDSFLAQFDTTEKNSIFYGIRCLLDKRFGRTQNQSPFFNNLSPWLTPVTNGLVSISGFPDPTIETETTEGGYHQEDQTYAKGGLGLYRSQQLQLNFKDVQGGPLMNLFLVWLTIIAQLRDGRLMSYVQDINKNIIPYMVGIYHFNLDPTKNYITNWAKCTMCFPLSVPFGALMNKSENQRYITTAGEFSVPFMCNFIHYRQLNDLRAFNILAKRYYPKIDKAEDLPLHKNKNFDGLPYIVNDTTNNRNGGFRLVYKQLPDDYLPSYKKGA